jgi:hypothetical protein
MPTGNVSTNAAEDATPLDSPLWYASETFDGSPGDPFALVRTDSSILESPGAETECPGHGKCAGQAGPCPICQRDKKEVSRKPPSASHSRSTRSPGRRPGSQGVRIGVSQLNQLTPVPLPETKRTE